MHIHLLRKMVGWRFIVVTLGIATASLAVILGNAHVSAATTSGHWEFAAPYKCFNSNDTVSAKLIMPDGSNSPITFTCFKVSGAAPHLGMLLRSESQYKCSPTVTDQMLINLPDFHTRTNSFDWFCADQVYNGHTKDNNQLSNTYDEASVIQPTGKGVWDTSGVNARLFVDFTGGKYTTPHHETFVQTSVSDNVMELTGDKAVQDCPADVIDIGYTKGYLDDTVGDITTYNDGSVGPTTNGCLKYVGEKGIQLFDATGKVSSYKAAGGKAVAGTGTAVADCPINDNPLIDWILCPIYFMGKSAITLLNGQIQILLYVDTSQIFGPAFQGAYNIFRNIGLALLVFAGLFMVISEAAGLEILSAHTIRKALPRIVLAAIGMSLAWPVLQFAVTFFNDLGSWISYIIIASTNTAAGTNYSGIQDIGVTAIQLLFTAVAGTIVILIFGVFGGFSFLLTFILGLLIGYLVLVIRQLVIIVCILAAPLAIAASVLPGTDKLWKFWKDTLLGVLVMFPIVMAFLSAGAALSVIAGSSAKGAGEQAAGFDAMAMIAYFAPYFMLPFAFRMASGLMGNIFGIVNDRGKGAFERLRNYRKGEKEFFHNRRMEGKGAAPGRLGRGFQNLYRRANTRGGLGVDQLMPGRLGAGARNRYTEFDRKRLSLAAENTLGKEDAGFAANDDTSNELAQQRGMTRRRFINEYMAATGGSQQRAERALGMLEASYGAQLGSDGMRLAAFKAAQRSATAYRFSQRGASSNDPALTHQQNLDNALLRRRSDAGDMVRDGLMSAEEAVVAVKASGAMRRDASGIAFGTLLTQIQNASGQNGPRAVAATAGDITTMRNSALDVQPHELVRGRPEALEALAPQMLERIIMPPEDDTNIGLDPAERRNRELARVAGIYDAMASTNPMNASVMANVVMQQHIPAINGGDGRTIQQLIDDRRNDARFLEMRHEFRTAGAAGAAAAASAPTAPQE